MGAPPVLQRLIITFVGVGLALGNWVSLAMPVVVPTVGLIVRIQIEEQILFAALGEPYRRYATGRRRRFPGLW